MKLQSFLGLVNQVREYIPNLAENLKPLHKKLKKDVEYYFDKKDQEQIQKIKSLCKKLPKLYFPDENKKFTYIVESDASEISYGGTEILIKACFREGIDTPIEIYLADDRIIEPIERSIISAVKGNLIYQKFNIYRSILLIVVLI